MMRKLIVLIGIAAMVFGMVGGAYASATDWLVYLKATDHVGQSGIVSSFIFGTRTGALDGLDGNDAANTAGSGSQIVLACYDLGPGAANNGFSKDLRAPNTPNNVWNLKLWAQPGSNATAIKLSGWNPTGTFDLVAPMHLIVVNDPTGSYAPGHKFTFNPDENGTATAPQFTWEFGVARADIPIELMLIPEPGSILAMLSGLVGLAGYAVRRRK